MEVLIFSEMRRVYLEKCSGGDIHRSSRGHSCEELLGSNGRGFRSIFEAPDERARPVRFPSPPPPFGIRAEEKMDGIKRERKCNPSNSFPRLQGQRVGLGQALIIDQDEAPPPPRPVGGGGSSKKNVTNPWEPPIWQG